MNNYPKPEIYIQIDSSDLKSIIPPNDEIIYNTLCDAYYKYVKGGTEYSVSWQTHILLTTSGLAYNEMNYDESKEYRFIPWHKLCFDELGLNVNRASSFIRNSRDDHTTFLRIITDPDNPESIETFAERSNRFDFTYRKFLINLKKNGLKQTKIIPMLLKKKKNVL